MRISGIIPLRNAVKLGYPFELAICSMRPLCDEIVVLVDPTSEDNTLARVRALSPDVVVESAWDMTNHNAHVSSEIARQTAIALERATGDWVLSLQADELLHEKEADRTRQAIESAVAENVSALELTRWYFFGSLTKYRDDWTVPLPRLFQRGRWRPDPRSGAMYFVPIGQGERKAKLAQGGIYHYSRVGDPALIARRVRNLDTFYHDPSKVHAEIPDYSFELRKLDTYVVGHQAEIEPVAKLLDFPLGGHPAMAREHFKEH